MFMNQEDVLNFLPHRDPFLFINSVDKIEHPRLNLTPGKDHVEFKEMYDAEVSARYYTRPDHPIFEGHFPDYPILPGVVQVEMMAQATSFGMRFVSSELNNHNMDVALLGVNSAKFRRPILPDMHLSIKTKCLKCRGPISTYACEIYEGDKLMSQAEVMASIRIKTQA